MKTTEELKQILTDLGNRQRNDWQNLPDETRHAIREICKWMSDRPGFYSAPHAAEISIPGITKHAAEAAIVAMLNHRMIVPTHCNWTGQHLRSLGGLRLTKPEEKTNPKKPGYVEAEQFNLPLP